jgi:TolB-like protein
MKRRLTMFVSGFAVFSAVASAGVLEVSLKLPLKPRLSITGEEKLAVAPFVIVTTDQDSRSDRGGKVDIQSEFSRYLRKQLTKSTKMQVVDVGSTRLPGNSMKELEANTGYWKELGARTGADYILSGVIDFDVEDKSGYRTEEYVSPVDGRTYYRQVLVETTGFVFDIVIAVFDADSGEKLIEENFRDFKEFDQRNYDEILGLFENLRSLESQLLGIFVAQDTSATRYVFTN